MGAKRFVLAGHPVHAKPHSPHVSPPSFSARRLHLYLRRKLPTLPCLPPVHVLCLAHRLSARHYQRCTSEYTAVCGSHSCILEGCDTKYTQDQRLAASCKTDSRTPYPYIAKRLAFTTRRVPGMQQGLLQATSLRHGSAYMRC